ncbi:GGDEF domain-containing protein, partial [Ferrovum sp.]|uniref:GGDEF domain-containing protein n=1 Tax=Ferrovum sp. TaxID=2609467 RepID=UPI00262C3684
MKTSHQSLHDFLTDLPNRSLLSERAAQVMEMANRHHKQFAILFLDLDHFKHINDSLGHQIGDLLLVAVGKRLVSCVRQTDTVCRQGGDEFVILLSEIRRLEDASNISEKLLLAFGIPFVIDNQELHITLSIGISIYPDDAGEVEAVIQNADTAMYQAKTNGRNNYQFFRAEMNVRAVHHLGVENSLRRALKSQ